MHGFFHVSQTNFQVLTLTKRSLFKICKEKRVFSSFLIILFSILFLSSCSTKPTIKKTDNPSKSVIENEPEIVTAEEKLALARSLHTKLLKTHSADNQSVKNEQSLQATQAHITELLIEASELFAKQENFTKALWLANEISKTNQSDDLADLQKHNQYLNNYRLLMVKANSLLALNFHQQAQQQLNIAKELVDFTHNKNITPSLSLTFEYYQTLTKVLLAHEHLTLALVAQLNAFVLNPEASIEEIQSIWHALEILAPWQVSQLINSEPPFIKGWAQLLNFSQMYGANPEQFSEYLDRWQQNNPAHPAMAIIPQLRLGLPLEKMIPDTLENIAVLLPLTGGQQKAGLAAQQGILAAYDNNPSTNVFFIDTNQIDWSTLGDNFAALKIDHIIGPLLKPNVEALLDVSMQHAALQIPTLLLNLPAQHSLAPFQAALSMRPEDEAIQAAATLSQLNYEHPIVLSHNDRVSKRIAIAFRDQWQSSTSNTVDIVYFDQGQQMQASLKDSLDINASQTRILELNSRLKYNIESEPRNRRDIDMIYLVGTAAQTRLIKPYIDVNTSPFSDVIPVYASSRSHSDFNDKNTASSMSDLQGLTFTQIPWLLNSKQQNKELSKLSDELWPKRTDSLSRIFAMGVDSYQLLGKVTLMKQYPYIRHFGQTGVLQLNNENILTRSLVWGQYINDKVMQVAME